MMKRLADHPVRSLGGILLVVAFLFLPAPVHAKAEHVLKIATLAPDGSVWFKAMGAIFKYVEEQSGGRIRIRIYGNGVMGDEPDVVRKMKLGLLDGAAVTLYGIWVACPELLVAELPLMFSDRDIGEADHFHKVMARAFDPYAEKRGYRLITITTAGFAHICSQEPLDDIIRDLPRQKFWQWEGEPVMQDLSRRLNLSAISLPLTDAITGLQTGMINAYYGTPMHILGVQWARHTQYLYRPSIFYAPACLVFTMKSWNRLPKDIQDLFFDAENEKIKLDVIHMLHEADNRALRTLENSGVKVVQIPPDQLKTLRSRTREVWEAKVGELYPQELLDRTIKILEEYRKGQ